jgi:PBP1b-binding outer membrane lipoprotein LpoB
MRQVRRYNVALWVVGALILVGCASQQEPEPAAQPAAPVDVVPVPLAIFVVSIKYFSTLMRRNLPVR